MSQSRKWLITINNPIEHDFDHARIKAAVLDLPSLVYWCMCDEQGDESTVKHGKPFSAESISSVNIKNPDA